MTFLPIVDREMRVAARLPATYRNRALAAGGLGLIALAMLCLSLLLPFSLRIAETMFSVLAYCMFAYCLLEGVRKTADCLSEERREGTLGLLFLTDLRGYDIVLGKLAASSLGSIYGLLGMLPILAFALLLGGVTAGEYWRMALVLTNTQFFSLTAGLFISSLSHEERRAMAGTLAVVLIMLALPALTTLRVLEPLSPGHAFNLAFASAYFRDAAGYWRSLLVTQFVSWILLSLTALIVTRFRQSESASFTTSPAWQNRLTRWRFGSPGERRRRRAEMLDRNPIFWLAGRDQGMRLLLWLLVALVCAVAVLFAAVGGSGMVGLFVACALVLNFIIKMRLAADSCHFLATARSNAALEMLLCTPLTLQQIISGQLQALWRTFGVPVLLILLVEACGIIGLTWALSGALSAGIGALFLGVIGVGYLVGFYLDARALAWVGMWQGISSPKESAAIFKTIGYVLFLPLLPVATFILWFFYLPAAIAWPLLCQAIAKQKLQYQFRTLAGQRFLPPPPSSRWWSLARRQYSPLPPLLAESGAFPEAQFPTAPPQPLNDKLPKQPS